MIIIYWYFLCVGWSVGWFTSWRGLGYRLLLSKSKCCDVSKHKEIRVDAGGGATSSRGRISDQEDIVLVVTVSPPPPLPMLRKPSKFAQKLFAAIGGEPRKVFRDFMLGVRKDVRLRGCKVNSHWRPQHCFCSIARFREYYHVIPFANMSVRVNILFWWSMSASISASRGCEGRALSYHLARPFRIQWATSAQTIGIRVDIER